MAELTYRVSWTCGSCKRLNEKQFDKVKAAFFECERPRPACRFCGSRSKSIPPASRELPEIDLELLEVWFHQDDFFFISQDEDLLIADVDTDILKAFLEKDEASPQRASALGPSLAVKLYDGGLTAEDKEWLIDWLRQNGEHWQGHTMGYIKRKVHDILRNAT